MVRRPRFCRRCPDDDAYGLRRGMPGRKRRRKAESPKPFTAETVFGSLANGPATLRQDDRIHELRQMLGRLDPNEIEAMTMGEAWETIGNLGGEV